MKKVLSMLLALTMLLSVVCVSAFAEGYTIAMLPKLKGENYFDACKTGADEAAAELGITLLYDAPPADNATNQKQVDLIEGWVAQGVDAIVVSPVDGPTLAKTLKEAMDEGVAILTFDSDTAVDARNFFVNQAAIQDVVNGLMQTIAKDLQEKGYGPDRTANLAIISAVEAHETIYAWEKGCVAALDTEDYNWIKLVNPETDILRIDGSETSTNESAAAVLSRMGEGEDQYQACLGLSTMATAAMAAQYEALAVKPDPTSISLVGLSTPNGVKSYIKDDANPMNYTVLWNPIDLGYLSIQAAVQYLDGALAMDADSVEAGRLGSCEIIDQEILLGPTTVFDNSNIDDFDY